MRDVFALGAVLYELMTGTPAFRGSTKDEVLIKVVQKDPTPPRLVNPQAPLELERICLKALSKRASDRYLTAEEMADDLNAWLSPTSSAKAADASFSMVPKGMRSFDASDAHFFLSLLPGPRNRDGLPESIDFWKQKIEDSIPEQSSAVGLIYGPSGCGKSSLVKAGVIPRLSRNILAVFVEATADDTEVRILQGLRSRMPELTQNRNLVETLGSIRLEHDCKVVIFIDQFEQWLHAHRTESDPELVTALRQCDGTRLQAIVMVRDDFWLAVSRFMDQIEIELNQGVNIRLVDLFDTKHAVKVLTRIGQAYQRIPAVDEDITVSQREFLTKAVEGLAEDGRVVSVRLALLGEMAKSKSWQPETLAEMGGTEGVGIAFLEETFSSRFANPKHRQHQKSARATLFALLPELGTNIKGQMRSHQELQDAAGLNDRPEEFTDLLRILDGELRLITPTDPEGDIISSEGKGVSHSNFSPSAPRYYQLTHDYLVPSLREWLTRKQKETRKGRAELKLDERAALWMAKPENRHLPSLREWISIRWLTSTNKWTEPQRKIMQKAGRLHLLRTGAFVAILLIASLSMKFILDGQKTASLFEALQTASPEQLIRLVQQADESRNSLDRLLLPLIKKADAADAAPSDRAAALPARLVLARRDSSQVKPLSDLLLSSDLAHVEPIRTRLRQYANDLRPQWLDVFRNDQESNTRRFRAALGLAGLDGDQSQIEWTDSDLQFIADELTSSFGEYQPLLRNLLRPMGLKLVPALDSLFDAESATEDHQINATMALVDFADDDAELMAELLTRATVRQTEILYPKIAESRSGPVRDRLLAVTKEQPDETLEQMDRVRLGQRRANAALALLRQGEREAIFEILRIRNDPEALSQFVARCRQWEVSVEHLLECVDKCDAARSAMTGAARQAEDRVLFGLLLAIGDYSLDQVPTELRQEFIKRLIKWYATDSSSGIHGATGWLLKRWNQVDAVTHVDMTPIAYDPAGDREWYVQEIKVETNSGLLGATVAQKRSLYLTFIVFPAAVYTIGSPGEKSRRQGDDFQHSVMLTRPLAVCNEEMSWRYYDPIDQGQKRLASQKQLGRTLVETDPVFGVNWYESITYSRWLSAQAGIDESDQCYDPPENLPVDGYGNPEYKNLDLTGRGFRLLTDAEWEVVCRGGMMSAYSFGGDVGLLGDYAWFDENSEERSHPVGQKRPNARGLFDCHGNQFEWCHDQFGNYGEESLTKDPLGAVEGYDRVLRGGSWNSDRSKCRSPSRDSFQPPTSFPNFGFRIALNLPSGESPEVEQSQGTKPLDGGI